VEDVEQRFGEVDMARLKREAERRWINNDEKGNRQAMYTKGIVSQTHNMLKVAEKTRLDKLKEYSDSYWCLRTRKRWMKHRILFVMMCENVISSPIFEWLIIIVICLNSVMLALEDPTLSSQAHTFYVADLIFQGIYTLEMVLKISGLGFILNQKSYLRDAWNILDFLIVISGFFSIFFSSGVNLRSLRTIRVLRPLKTIQTIAGLRVLVTALISALPLLRDTIIILIFFFIIFAIAGVQMLSGVLKRRCMDPETGIIDSNYLCGGA